MTNDEATPASALAEVIDEAQRMLQDALGRKLEFGLHVEKVPVWPNGLAYPAAVPIGSVAASAAYSVLDEATLRGVPQGEPPEIVWSEEERRSVNPRLGSGYEERYTYNTVEYFGGWTEDTLPPVLKRSIVRLAHALRREFDPDAPIPGASMVRVGDVQVNTRQSDSLGILDQYVPGMSKRLRGFYLGRL